MSYTFKRHRRIGLLHTDSYIYRHEDRDREIGVLFNEPDGDFLVLRYGERTLTFVSLEDYDAEMAEIREAVANAIERRMGDKS